MASSKVTTFLALLVALFVIQVFGAGKHYEIQQEVPFFVNKIGPFSNPSESYEFYTLPFCTPPTVQHKHSTIGEDFTGDHKVSSVYDIRFGVPIMWTKLCAKHLQKEEIEKFKDAIEKYYYFEMTYDDLPVRGFIGTMEKEALADGTVEIKHYLFKHFHFSILYNEDQVIHINVTADPSKLQLLQDSDLTVEFSYSAKWESTDIPYEKRNALYIDNFAKELEIHWLSIMNSVVLVLLLSGFLAIIILRILRSDYSRYASKTNKVESQDDEAEDYGWKLVHGDVFRFPPYKLLFTSLVGLGTQGFTVMFGLLFLALFGLFYPNNNGTIYVSGIVLYALTCGLGGYVAASYYKQMGGEHWQWNIVMVAALFLLPVLTAFSFVNTTAVVYETSTAVAAVSVAWAILMLLIVGFPLTVIGGIAGRRNSQPFSAPVRTKNFPREIPPIPWYRSLMVQMIMSGFLPFSAIYIELFYLFSSVWGHSSYQLFGILFLVAIILVFVTACITIALIYFQLSMEDHRWWWSSFFSGGSTGFFVYGYSIFYYFYRSRMSGFVQASFFFAYMAVVCYFFFVILGTVGFYSSLIFVRKIYANVKCD